MQAAPTQHVLNLPLPATDIHLEDINSDDIKDIFIVSVDSNNDYAKKVYAYLSDPDHTQHDAPTFTLPIEAKTGALFFAEVDGTAPRELVTVHATAATVYTFKENTFQKTKTTSLFALLPTNAQEPLFLKKSAQDLDNDGIDEWILPHPEGFALQHADKTLAIIPCDMRSEFRRGETMYIYNRLPSFTTFQSPDSETKGIACLSDEYADFAYGDNWEKHYRFKIPRSLEEKWEANAQIADINNDGFPDIAVTQTKGTVNLESKSQIYIATAPFEYPSTPNAEFNSKGALSAPMLRDIDGNDTLDAIVFNIPFGLKNIMSFFLRNKVSVNIGVHEYENNTIAPKPTRSTSLSLAAPEGREIIAHTLGDFDEDNLKDLAFTKSPEEFVIHSGDPESFLQSSPMATFNIPAFGVAKTGHLNANTNDDIILIHPGGDNNKRVDLLLF